MIPILYDYNETTFTSNGLGRLSDALRVEVTEERNGIYELEMDYPMTGLHFDEILPGRIIGCTHDEDGDVQPFDIYSVSKPIDGVVTFYAHHISYRLNEVTVTRVSNHVSLPVTAAWSLMVSRALPSGALGSWTFSTDLTASHEFVHEIDMARSFLGGSEGSMLDTWGGEFLWDKFTVNLLSARGANNGVRIVYRSNLTGYEEDTDFSESFDGVFPYWIGETENGTERVEGSVQYDGSLPHGRHVVIPYDFSADFEAKPTAAQLNTAAANLLTANAPWLPSRTFDISFVQLWQTEEYKDIAPLLKVKLCDTVLVTFPEYGITDMAVKVVKVVWDTLADKYKEMTLGTPSSSFAETLLQGSDQRQADVDTRISQISGLLQDVAGDVSTISGTVSTLSGNVSALDTKVSNLLSTATASGSVASIAAEGSQTASINIARSGYTPLGIVGITKSGAGSGYVDIAAYSISGNTASIQLHNANNGARSTIGVVVTVLYVAN